MATMGTATPPESACGAPAVSMPPTTGSLSIRTFVCLCASHRIGYPAVVGRINGQAQRALHTGCVVNQLPQACLKIRMTGRGRLQSVFSSGSRPGRRHHVPSEVPTCLPFSTCSLTRGLLFSEGANVADLVGREHGLIQMDWRRWPGLLCGIMQA